MRIVAAAVGALLILTSTGSVARAEDQKIPVGDLPKAVVDAVKAKFPKCEIRGAEKDVDLNSTKYEVSLKDENRLIEAELKPDGTILEIEKSIPVGDLPAAVAQVLAKEYPKSTLRKAEERTTFKNGKEEKSYEVDVIREGGKKLEVKLSSTGQILKRDDDGADHSA